MKLPLEKILFEYLQKNLDSVYVKMLVMGHSTEERPLPYIAVDCEEIKPFGDLSMSDGIASISINIAIADSAHAINYDEQERTVDAIFNCLENFTTEEILIYSFEFDSMQDARDDNNIGNVLKYTAIIGT